MTPALTDAVAIAAAVNAGSVRPGDPAAASVAAVEALNPRLNAFVDFDPDVAAPQVEGLRARLAAGERPPLAGVPVAVKDSFMVRGWRFTEGSVVHRDRRAAADEPVIERLRRAGAILVGRTNMSEFGCKGVTTNLLYGPTRHPLDPALTPGGSSGGAASAVAAGMVPLALATDGGGSVRRPAAHVGAVGLKPSTGAVADPRDFSHTSVFGVIAGTVADAALMFEAIAGPDPLDPVSVPLLDGQAGDPRIAWSPRLGLDVAVDGEVAEGVAAAVGRLGGAGLRIEPADPAWPPGASEAALMPIQHAGLAAAYGERWLREPEAFDPDIGAQIESGLRLAATDVARAQGLSLEVARAAARFFAGGFDLVLSPTVPCAAWPLERLDPPTIGGRPSAPRGHAALTPFLNHAFCPTVTVPAGRTGAGLPFGLQVAGPRLSDRRVLAAAARVEAALAVGP